MGTKGTGRIDSYSRLQSEDKSELSSLMERWKHATSAPQPGTYLFIINLPHPVKGINTMCANMTDHPIAAGAMLSAMFFLYTAVKRTVKTNRKVPTLSKRKALPMVTEGVRKLEANLNGGLSSPPLVSL
jgi:hypothetical protein